jgi:hypothetical protein
MIASKWKIMNQEDDELDDDLYMVSLSADWSVPEEN